MTSGTSRLSCQERYSFKEITLIGERKEKITLEIRVHDDNIEKAIKDLKRQLQKEGLFKEIKKRSFYEKPSVKDRRKRREAQKRRMKAQRRKSFYD
jgi:small subunit ribosomal protein S21